MYLQTAMAQCDYCVVGCKERGALHTVTASSGNDDNVIVCFCCVGQQTIGTGQHRIQWA